ncbi:STAS domain-containing protein [Planobispora siamensis]|uniref:Anti-sigma factor antagonist n=1 Tax=Planobispora siamensis TaxID=936338 RepID=A0A8J3SHT4_9ACTN|nr:STAS domain-containing protein [Planobispora siamensis]GIH93240.1 hypothetical protein Psi01_38700 [Planobispora siamensis]
MSAPTSSLTWALDHEEPEACVLRLTGELDYTTSVHLKDALDDLGACRNLIADVSQLTFCDSTGLRMLLNARQTITTSGGVVALVGANARLNRILNLTGLARAFSLHATLAEAHEALAAASR